MRTVAAEPSLDPVERVSFACEFLLRGVHSCQGAVRAMISGTITRPGFAATRPGIRFGLITTRSPSSSWTSR